MAWFTAILGLVIGSFLNVLIDRLPKGQNVLWGRSRCDSCRRNLRWFELIPVVSFILQRGRCLRCKKRLSPQYPAVEMVTAAGFFMLSMYIPNNFTQLLAALVIFSSSVVIFVADLKYQVIPDSMVITSLMGTFLWIWSTHSVQTFLIHVGMSLAVGGFFYLLWLVTKGRGMGFGDVKFSFVLGFLLGYPGAILGLYIAFLTGAGVGVILILTGKKGLKSKIAFGPFLLVGLAGVVLFHTELFKLWHMFL